MGAAAKRTGGLRGFSPHRSSSVERQIRDAIAEIGLQRAREIFEEIAQVFRNG